MKRVLTIFAITVLTATALFGAEPQTREPADFSAGLKQLETLPMFSGGRIKPFYTFAEETLKTFTGKTSFRPEDSHRNWNAMEILVSIWLEPKRWQDEPLIRIPNRKLKKIIQLNPRYTFFSYEVLKEEPLLKRHWEGLETFYRTEPKLKYPLQRLREQARLAEGIMTGQAFRILPHEEEWQPVSEQLELTKPLKDSFQELRRAWVKNQPKPFAQAVSKLRAQLRQTSSTYPREADMSKEVFYLKLQPLNLAFVCTFIGWLLMLAVPKRISFLGAGWIVAGMGLQLGDIASRVLISGRPPVTNMYETVIWVAFGVVLLALIFSARYRTRSFLLSAAPMGMMLIWLAQSSVLDASIKPLLPILRDNIWLAFHVPTITLGYACFALAMGMGHVYLVRALWFQTAPERQTALEKHLFQILKLGLLFLVIGIVLGGIWANSAWGRFWGWDPKETWALITLLCYLLILHGWLSRWWSSYGLAFGAILGFLVVVVAWYGVNFILGTGLHSYGAGAGGWGFIIGYTLLETAFLWAARWTMLIRKTIESPAHHDCQP